IAESPKYDLAFHDIIAGNSGILRPKPATGYSARPGWDPVTGWGTPNVASLVPLLARGTPRLHLNRGVVRRRHLG
ncbi:MAG TPA: hypothetical protein VME46_04860, partial [Acidimicrobiales bacterium]|nr:hypothetical protein [Acidimicrobiales bacterium]